MTSPAGFPVTVVPMDRAGLAAWRSAIPSPPRRRWGGKCGPRWELTVLAGGPADGLDTTPIETAAVASLGQVLGGLGVISFGLQVPATVPAERHHPDDRLRQLRRARAELHRRPHEHHAITVVEAIRAMTLRASTGKNAGWTRSTALLDGGPDGDAGLGARWAPAAWANLPGLPGSLWLAYGVLLVVEHAFPVERTERSGPGGRSRPHWFPAVDDEFWDPVGRAVVEAAERCGLPAWPLLEGSLYDWAAGASRITCWQSSP